MSNADVMFRTVLLTLLAVPACASTLDASADAGQGQDRSADASPEAARAQGHEKAETLMSKRILFVLTSHGEKGSTGQTTGAYLSEITHPYEAFRKAGATIDFVSVKGGKVPLDGVDRKDPINAKYLDDPTFLQRLETTRSPSEVDPEDYDAVFYAGGHGTMWDFPNAELLAAISAQVYENGGVVAAVCHGPAGLVNIKLSDGSYLVAGKDVAAFTNEEEDAVGLSEVVPFLLADALVERGAKHLPGPKWQSKVVVSDRLVTGQNPASATGVAQSVAELLSASE